MKKLLFFCLAFTLTASTVIAQDNVIKLDLGTLLNRTVNLEYERVINESQTANAEIFFNIPRTLPSAIIETSEEQGADRDISPTETSVGGYGVAAEYRFYTAGDAPDGFYVGPYLKYRSYSFKVDGTYSHAEKNLEMVDAQIKGTYSVVNLGVILGYQWLINDQVAINWSFFGGGVGSGKLGIKFTSDDDGVHEAWEEDIREFLEGEDIPQQLRDLFQGDDIIESDDDKREISAETKRFLMPSIRSSISVGYAF